jgi:endonuclease/exonuclease/phosphatase family metal-dependent hydrolase
MTAQPADATISIVTWNVLAAPWAGAQWYPQGMDPTVLERAGRAARVGAALATLDVDLMFLQETTPTDLVASLAVVGDGWSVHSASNGSDLWSNWGSPETPWEANGPALAFRDERFDEIERGVIDLGPHGNVAPWVRLRDRVDDTILQAVSVHLDSDDPARRLAEIDPLLAGIDGDVVVVAGDCNEDTVTGAIGRPLFAAGFVDVLAELGRREPTFPYARPGDDWELLCLLDHVLVRGLTPRDGEVLDAGTWSVDDPNERIGELLRRTGADHLAVRALVAR